MKKKCDVNIGYRAVQEVFRLFPGTTKSALAAIGCGKCVINEWGKGVAPSAKYLARLHELGADVIWILTGKKENE